MYVNNIEPEVFLPPGSENFNHNATRTSSSRSRSHNVNNNIVSVYTLHGHVFVMGCVPLVTGMGLFTGMDYRNGHLFVVLRILNAFYMNKNTFEVI